jgi:hypothetical protein
VSSLYPPISQRAPTQFAARVADFNDNLFYEMQVTRGIKHLVASNVHEDEDGDEVDGEVNEHDESLSSTSSSLLSSSPSSSSSSSSSSCMSFALESSIAKFEKLLSADEYLGSFLTTEATIPQPPHVDYTWEVLDEHCGDDDDDDENKETKTPDLMLGFFPLTQEGTFVMLTDDRRAR